jgi:hypothetical protein
LREGEDPETFAAMVRLWGRLHDAEMAFEAIANGYGVNHTSKWARDTAKAAIKALGQAHADTTEPQATPDTQSKQAEPS